MQALRLTPWMVPARRAAGQVQFGHDPDLGFILSGLSEAETHWLTTLEHGADLPSMDRSAREHGLAESRTTRLLQILRDHGLVAEREHTPEADTPLDRTGQQSRQQRLRCEVHGTNHLAAVMLDHLREIPNVDLPDPCRLPPSDPGSTDVAVVVPGHADHDLVMVAARHVLPVSISASTATVGPVVETAAHQNSDAPCLRCLDHYAGSTRAPWSGHGGHISDLPESEVRIDLAAAATAITTRIVAMLATGQRVPVGVSWEWGPSWPAIAVRDWAQHPMCAHLRG